jgi:asparagine synthase (glutamine-hydrolysing)
MASDHVSVVLSGDGGDELFAGYDKYRVEARERRYDRIPSALRGPLAGIADLLPRGVRGRNFLRHFALAGSNRYLDASTLFREDDKRWLLTEEAWERVRDADPWRREAEHLAMPEGDWLSRLQYTDLKGYLPQDILTKVDRMSAANSIEARVPFLDHHLVEFVSRLPSSMKLSGDRSKHILKRAMSGLLPESILNRPKQGFAVPLDEWFRGRLESYVRDLLLSDTARLRGIFKPESVEALLAMHGMGRRMDLHLWSLISFELWCRRFMDAPAPARIVHRPDRRKVFEAVATA